MTALQDAFELDRADQGLAVVATLRADTTIRSSVVNTSVLAHPVTTESVLAFVAHGKVKLANLRPTPGRSWSSSTAARSIALRD